MKLQIITILFILLTIPVATALSINSIDSDNAWIITKKTGLEKKIDVNIDKTGNVILRLDKAIGSEKRILRNRKAKSKNNKQVNRFIDRVEVKLNKGDKYFMYGSNTILIEENSYWHILNNRNSWYISKTGFQVSNEPTNSYANIEWEIDYNGVTYNSMQNIWTWTINENTTQRTNLTGTADINGVLKWIANWYLEEDDQYITITLTTNDTTKNYNQKFIHKEINITNDSTTDYINIIDLAEYTTDTITDTNYTGSNEIEISDSNKFISILFSQITDAIINVKDGVVTIYSDLKTIIIQWTDPTFSNNNLDGTAITALNASSLVVAWCDETNNQIAFRTYHADGTPISAQITTGSDTSQCYNEGHTLSVSALSDNNFVLGWVEPSGQAEFQVFNIDGTAESDLTETDAVVGFSHGATVTSLNSSRFIFSWFDDGTTNERVRYQMFNLNAPFDITNITTIIQYSDVDIGNGQDVSCSAFNSTAFGCIWHDEGATTLRYESFIDETTVNNEVSLDSTFTGYSELQMSALNQTAFAAAWIDGTQISYGVFNFDGTPIIAQTNIDTIAATTENVGISAINSTSFAIIYTDDTPFRTKLTTIDTSGNTIIPITEVLTSQDEGVSVFSSSANKAFCNDNLAFAGFNGVSNIWNGNNSADLSIWDGLCQATAPTDNPPTSSLALPLDNTITNETSISFDGAVSDDNLVTNATLYHNLSGTFTGVSTQIINEASTNVLFNQTITINKTIIWNIEACDTLNQCTQAISSFTLTTNQTFSPPLPPPPPPDPLANISLDLPLNVSVDSDGTVTFTYNVNVTGNSTLFYTSNLTPSTLVNVETLFNVIGSNSFSPIQFNENQTISWFVNHTFNPTVTSGVFQLDIIKTQLGVGEIEAVGQEFSLFVCPIQTLQLSLFFMFMIVLAIVMFLIGLVMKIPILSVFGSLLFLVLSIFTFSCLFQIGILMTAIGFSMLIVGVARGLNDG